MPCRVPARACLLAEQNMRHEESEGGHGDQWCKKSKCKPCFFSFLRTIQNVFVRLEMNIHSSALVGPLRNKIVPGIGARQRKALLKADFSLSNDKNNLIRELSFEPLL